MISGVVELDNRHSLCKWRDVVDTHNLLAPGQSSSKVRRRFRKYRALSPTQSLLLHSEQHPPISTNNLSRTPPSLTGAKQPHHPRHLLPVRWPPPRPRFRLAQVLCINPLPRPHQRRMLDKRPDMLNKPIRHIRIHFCQHGPRIDGIDRTPLAQLSRPRPRHGLERRFGPAVDRLADKAGGARDGRDVYDPAGPVRGEVRLRGLDEKQGAQDVDAVRGVKVGHLDLRDGVYDGHAGVVDDDVDLELAVALGESILGGRDESGGTFGGANVGLGHEGADFVLGHEGV